MCLFLMINTARIQLNPASLITLMVDVLTVYFGAFGMKKARRAVVAGLFVDIVSLVAVLFICRLVFSS